MSTLELKKSDIGQKRLIQDDQYYKHIFKKTEKITCAVLYIFKTNNNNQRQITLITDIEDTARSTHQTILMSLQCRTHQCTEVVENCAHALVSLESKLRLAHAAELIPGDVMHVLAAEIEGTLRSVARYLDESMRTSLHIDSLDSGAAPERRAQNQRGSVRPSTKLTPGSAERKKTRRDRILDVIIDKQEVAIKDISDIVSDCSEKTIQRELNDLIKDNKIKKTGDRRWSRYSIQN